MSVKIIEKFNDYGCGDPDAVFNISEGDTCLDVCVICQKQIPKGDPVVTCSCLCENLCEYYYCEKCILEDPNINRECCHNFCDGSFPISQSHVKMHKILNHVRVLKQLIYDGSTFEIDGIAYTAITTSNDKKAKK